MNYYEHHLGDYARDTAHLSMLEHGAYRLLLDRYYATEKGIPADQAHRLARARTREERDAVDSVLAEFFVLTDGVWCNRRADEEVAKAQIKITAAQANGKKGGRPKKNPTTTQEKPSGFPAGSENETQPKAHQAPSTKHQTPLTSTESISTEEAPEPTEAARVCLALKAFGITANPSHPLLLTLVQAGATPQEFVDAAPAADGKRDPFAYLLSVVQGRRQDAAEAAKGLHKGAMPAPQAKPPTAAELRVFRSSPQLMDPVIRARCEAFVGAQQPASDPLNVIDMEAPNGLAIGLD